MKLRYTLPALADLDAILGYIQAYSPQSAQRIQARIHAITELLPLYPQIGIRTDDPALRRFSAAPYPYLIFYEVTEAEIIVHAVRHGARDPAGMPGAPKP